MFRKFFKFTPITFVLLICLIATTVLAAWLLLAKNQLSFTSAEGVSGTWASSNCVIAGGTPGTIVGTVLDPDGPHCTVVDVEQDTEIFSEARLTNDSASDICFESADFSSLPAYVTADTDTGMGGAIPVGSAILPGDSEVIGVYYTFNGGLTASLSDTFQGDLVFNWCP